MCVPCECWACTNRLIGLHLIANGCNCCPLRRARPPCTLPSGCAFHAVFTEVVSASAAAVSAAPANRQLSSKCYLPFCAQTEAFSPCPTTTATTIRLPNGSTQPGQSSMRSAPRSTLEPEMCLKLLEWFRSCIKLLITRFFYKTNQQHNFHLHFLMFIGWKLQICSTKESIMVFALKS